MRKKRAGQSWWPGLGRLGAAAVGLALALTVRVGACTTPVFQYAVENWPADPYDLAIVCRPGAEEPLRREVEGVLQREDGAVPNVRLRFRTDADLAADAALLEVRFPFAPPTAPTVWSGALAPGVLKGVLDSPIRVRVVDELMKGTAAVFLFLESGKADADAEARRTLVAVLDEFARTVELPAADPAVAVADEAAPQKVRFEVIDVRRDDPEEAFLREMLLATEDDLSGMTEPMAFPVFGRGRALFAVVGRGINREVLLDACAFLTGPCSCQVKAMNPGVDLLLSAAWDRLLEGVPYEEFELPPLVGIGTGAAAAGEAAPMPESVEAEAPQEPHPDSCQLAPPCESVDAQVGKHRDPVVRAILFALGFALLVLAVSTASMLLGGSRRWAGSKGE